jgi:hypothetical protein
MSGQAIGSSNSDRLRAFDERIVVGFTAIYARHARAGVTLPDKRRSRHVLRSAPVVIDGHFDVGAAIA